MSESFRLFGKILQNLGGKNLKKLVKFDQKWTFQKKVFSFARKIEFKYHEVSRTIHG